MKRTYFVLAVAAAAAALGTPRASADSFSYSDCIISGMKGVNNNVAAIAIRQACETKQKEYKEQQVAALKGEFGDPLPVDAVRSPGPFEIESGGYYSIELTNVSRVPEMTLKYVKLAVWSSDGQNQPCDDTTKTTFAYKVSVKPGSAIKLMFPSDAKAICTRIESVRGKTPSWKDISLSGSEKPLERDPFDGF